MREISSFSKNEIVKTTTLSTITFNPDKRIDVNRQFDRNLSAGYNVDKRLNFSNERFQSSKPDWIKSFVDTKLDTRPSPRDSEIRAKEIYGGREQVSFLNGKEVPYGTPNSTRPDLVRTINGKIEAIEVKNYDLTDSNRVDALAKELRRQVEQRTQDLPTDSRQRIVLDPRGQNITSSDLKNISNRIQEACNSAYPNIPIETLTSRGDI